MVAYVSDFGLATILSAINDNSLKETNMSRIKGTIGYAPLGMLELDLVFHFNSCKTKFLFLTFSFIFWDYYNENSQRVDLVLNIFQSME